MLANFLGVLPILTPPLGVLAFIMSGTTLKTAPEKVKCDPRILYQTVFKYKSKI
jgi:hypothetical protein